MLLIAVVMDFVVLSLQEFIGARSRKLQTGEWVKVRGGD